MGTFPIGNDQRVTFGDNEMFDLSGGSSLLYSVSAVDRETVFSTDSVLYANAGQRDWE